jgi:hypothetical protein
MFSKSINFEPEKLNLYSEKVCESYHLIIMKKDCKKIMIKIVLKETKNTDYISLLLHLFPHSPRIESNLTIRYRSLTGTTLQYKNIRNKTLSVRK